MPNLYCASIEGNRLAIAGGAEQGRVYWVVSAERDDPKAKLERIARPVEQLKIESGLVAAGQYLSPDAYHTP